MKKNGKYNSEKFKNLVSLITKFLRMKKTAKYLNILCKNFHYEIKNRTYKDAH